MNYDLYKSKLKLKSKTKSNRPSALLGNREEINPSALLGNREKIEIENKIETIPQQRLRKPPNP